jgi:transketolase
MKCIKSIKATKNTEIGEIRRVSDDDANQKVESGYWKFIPKSEWKSSLQNLVEIEKQGDDQPKKVEVKTKKTEGKEKKEKKSKK